MQSLRKSEEKKDKGHDKAHPKGHPGHMCLWTGVTFSFIFSPPPGSSAHPQAMALSWASADKYKF